MTQIRTWMLTAAAASLVLFSSGCGPKPVPTKGLLTFNGKPLAKATVLFLPQNPDGQPATGLTDASGAFKLTTSAAGDGALPGSYVVTVQYSEVELRPGLKGPQAVQNASAEAQANRKPLIVVPERYTRVDQTPLRHRVPKDGDVNIALQSAAAD